MGIRGKQLLTLTLAGACGLLLLLVFALQFGVARGYLWQSTDDDTVTGLGNGGIDRVPFRLPPESQFAETDARPIFNEDRKPTPDAPEIKPPDTPPVPLNISLTGVMLTPQMRLAMIHDTAKNGSIALKEGMPLPGDLGGWTLTHVKDRSAIFKEMSGDEVEVELTTAVASPKPGPGGHPAGGPPARAGAAANGKTQTAAATDAKPAQGDDLQRRIEERRKQMRDEAERLKQQHPPQH
jgi:general secretion pathway protein N